MTKRLNKKEAAAIIKSLVINYAMFSARLRHPEEHATGWDIWEQEAKADLQKLADMGIDVNLLKGVNVDMLKA